MTDIGLMVRSANPVSDETQALTDDELSAVLLLAQQRSTDMDVQELTKPVEPESKGRRGWLIAALTFGAIIVVVGLSIVLTQDQSEETPPATTPPTTQAAPTTTEATPTTLAEAADPKPTEVTMTAELEAFISAYATAWNGDDPDAFAGLFDRAAQRDNGDANMVSLEKLLAERENLVAQRSELAISNCEARSNGVSCQITLDGPVEQALLGAPLESITRFHLSEDGLITLVEARTITNFGANDPWIQFIAWMEATHPTVREQMITPFFRDLVAYDDSEIWLEYAPLWAEAGRP